jgi:hypothetical protein
VILQEWIQPEAEDSGSARFRLFTSEHLFARANTSKLKELSG